LWLNAILEHAILKADALEPALDGDEKTWAEESWVLQRVDGQVRVRVRVRVGSTEGGRTGSITGPKILIITLTLTLTLTLIVRGGPTV